MNHKGIHPVADEVKAVVNATQPTNQSDTLKVFLGHDEILPQFCAQHLHLAGATTPALEEGL